MLERKHFVPILYSANYGGGVDGDSINMKNFHRATFIIGFGAIDGDADLTLNSGADNGVKTTAETFRYAFAGAARAAANCDVLAATATSAALELTGATYDNYMLIVEIDASDMTVGQEWLTLNISSAGTSGIIWAEAVLEPRYAGESTPTALT